MSKLWHAGWQSDYLARWLARLPWRMVTERKKRIRIGSGPAAGALLAGWVLVVVVGAGRRPDDNPLLGVKDLDLVVLGLFGVYALFGLALLIYLPSGDGPAEREPARRRSWLLVALCVLFLLWQPDIAEAPREEAERVEAVAQDTIEPVPTEPELPAVETVAQATDLLLLMLGVGAVGGLWFLARRSAASAEDAADGDDENFEADLLVAVDRAFAELEASGDPRAGVLNAYVALEGVLESHQKKRRRSETPTEHLSRVLAALSLDPAPFIELGALYELARFSEEAISADQRQRALRALGRARRELGSLT